MFPIGMKWEETEKVTPEKTACALGSGTVAVYGTPQMILLMEKTASQGIQRYLEPGQTSVGTSLEIAHTAATPVGMLVRCVAELVEAEGRRLLFQVDAYDEVGRIGGGRHERFIVREESFLAKAQGRKA